MQRTRAIVRHAARRRVFRRLVALTGPALTLGASLGLLGALTDRLVGPGLDWWVWSLLPAAALGLASAAYALSRRQTMLDAAVEVDHALRLHDRLGSALNLAPRVASDPFAALAVEQAEAAASNGATINLRRAVPIRWSNSWLLAPTLAGITAAICIFVPTMRLLAPRAQTNSALDDARLRDAAQQLRDAAAAAQPPKEDSVPAAPSERLAAIDRLAEQLERGERPPDEALSGAAGLLEEEAAESESLAEQSQREEDELRRSLAELPAQESSAPTETADATDAEPGAEPLGLREALRDGRIDDAGKALEEFERQLQRMPAAQRLEAAAELERLADELESVADDHRERAKNAAEQHRRELQDRGFTDEQSRALQEPNHPDPIEESLKNEGQSEDAARRLAEQIARENQERQAQENAVEKTEDLADAARDAADELKQPPPPGESAPQQDRRQQPPGPSAPEPQDNKAADPAAQPDQQSKDAKPDPGAPREQKPGDLTPPDAKPETKPGAEPKPRDDSQGKQPTDSQSQRPQPGAQPDPAQPSQPTEQKPGAQDQTQKNDPAAKPDPSHPSSQSHPPEQQKPDQPSGTQPQQRPAQPGDKPRLESAPTPDQQKQQPGQQPTSPDSKPESTPGDPQQQSGQRQTPPRQPGAEQAPPQPREKNPRAPGATPQEKPDPNQQDAPGQQPGQQQQQPGQEPPPDGRQPGAAPEDQKEEQPPDAQPPGGEIPPIPKIPENLPTGEALDRLKEQVRRMAEQQNQSEAQRQRARDLREQAQRMLDNASPEERERLMRWARQNLKEQDQDGSSHGDKPGSQPAAPSELARTNTPFKTEDVDARRADPTKQSRVAAEWTRPGRPAPDRSISRREMADQLREAQEAADQAIEDQVIPPRYKNVQEFYKRALKRADEPQPQAPAPAAQDAGKKN